jgi:hypothetical protein
MHGVNTYCLGVHVYYMIDVFAVDRHAGMHMLCQSYQVSDDWIGGVCIDTTEFASIRKLVVVAQQSYRTIDMMVN